MTPEIRSETSTEKTREALLNAAKELFAAQGYDGTSVKELADRAGVNISLVSYHFGGKEGLYRATLEQFGRTRLEVVQRLLVPPKSEEEFRVRMEMFIDEMLERCSSEPCVAKIIQREFEMGASIVMDIFRATFFKAFETLAEFIRTAQKRGFARKDIDSHTAAMMFIGAVTNFSRIDELNQKVFGHSIKDASYRKKVKEQLSAVFWKGFA